MKRSPAFFTLGTLAMTLGIGTPAKAQEGMALSFDLLPKAEPELPTDTASSAIAPPTETPAAPEPAAVEDFNAPLPIPPGAESPPFSGDSARPSGVYGGNEAFAVSAGQLAQALLPPPPPTPKISVWKMPQPLAEAAPTDEGATDAVETGEMSDLGSPTSNSPTKRRNIALSLNPFAKEAAEPASEIADAPSPASGEEMVNAIAAPVLDAANLATTLFQGGTDSLVAKAVGSAEGTRTPEGHKTPAYFGHRDPGNGVWNLGTFSFQHGAANPEEADSKQLARLQKQTLVLKEKAQAHGLTLSVEALLNGIDLANQAPLAALDRGGYIDWLAEAYKLNMTGAEAIVYARTRSFLDPDTHRWNAPGLGNNIYSIHHDQQRRADAITRALSANPLPENWLTAEGTEASATLTATNDAPEPDPAEATPCKSSIFFQLTDGENSCPSSDRTPLAISTSGLPDDSVEGSLVSDPMASATPPPLDPEGKGGDAPEASPSREAVQPVTAIADAVFTSAEEASVAQAELMDTWTTATSALSPATESGAAEFLSKEESISLEEENGSAVEKVDEIDEIKDAIAPPQVTEFATPVPVAPETPLPVPEAAKVDFTETSAEDAAATETPPDGQATADSVQSTEVGSPLIAPATEHLTRLEPTESTLTPPKEGDSIPSGAPTAVDKSEQENEDVPISKVEKAMDSMLEAFVSPRILLPDRPR